MNFETVKIEISFAKSMNLNLVFFQVKQCVFEFRHSEIRIDLKVRGSSGSSCSKCMFSAIK